MRHVLDFLNQMGFMTTLPGFLSHGPAASWTLFPGMEEALRSTPAPDLVSLRVSFDRELQGGSTRHIASVVFENGVFTNVPIDYAANHRSADRKDRLDQRDPYRRETVICGSPTEPLKTGRPSTARQ